MKRTQEIKEFIKKLTDIAFNNHINDIGDKHLEIIWETHNEIYESLIKFLK